MNWSSLFADAMVQLNTQIEQLNNQLNTLSSVEYQGKIVSAIGAIVTVTFPQAKIGDLCKIEDSAANITLLAEVIALNHEEVKLLTFGSLEQLSHLARVSKVASNFRIEVGEQLLGTIVDGMGNVIGKLAGANQVADRERPTNYYPINRLAPDPLQRALIQEPFWSGIKAIDLFMTCGRGQRLAILAGPGIGKTTLMGMLIRFASADVIVVALIGERGREVREFIDLELDSASHAKCILVVATADRPPVEQVKAAFTAQTIAEYFRDQGLSVLLLADSITRFARAQREVGLSAGEPVTRGGFPPSVFLAFPRLMERAGNNQHGSITAFYTVLMEGEQPHQDPIADEIMSIVDGHIVLSRKLAESGVFPAINILTSLSRVADRLITPAQQVATRRLRMLFAKYDDLEFLVRIGEYKRGSDPLSDEVIDKYPQILQLLQQTSHEHSDFKLTLKQLLKLAEK